MTELLLLRIGRKFERISSIFSSGIFWRCCISDYTNLRVSCPGGVVPSKEEEEEEVR